MRTLIAVLVILFLIFQYKLWFADGGFLDVIHQKKLIAAQVQKNQQLQQRNAILAAGIKAIRDSKQALESRARSDLGMIKKGETYYQVVSS